MHLIVMLLPEKKHVLWQLLQVWPLQGDVALVGEAARGAA